MACATETERSVFPRELTNMYLTKGTGFTAEERHKYKLDGLMPTNPETLEEQSARAIYHVRSFTKMLNKYIYMENLHSMNVKLFYKVLLDNVVELLPILYTPTVGEACQKFGSIFRNFAGLYVSVLERGSIAKVLDNWYEEPEIIVVTDGGRILGLGDQGAGGMGIPIGKLHLYVAGGGFHPAKTLPITVDVGTDRESLLLDPRYLGVPNKRLKGKEHEQIMDEFMEAVSTKWPKCIIQFEDFQSEYALKYLERYRHKYIHFNDDVQGTAAIVTAGFINGMKAQGTDLKDATVVMCGAGSSAVGVSGYLMKAMMMAGLSEREARGRIYMVDSKGLVTTTRGDKLNEWKAQFARTDGTPNIASLVDIVKHVKPNALFGLTGSPQSFHQDTVEALCEGCESPLIFPLSNPTMNAEITIEQAVEWSKGKCIFAAGSPFETQTYEGRTVYASQCNNMFIFPGVGMGAKLSACTTITDTMMLAASKAVADFVPEEAVKAGKLFPDLQHLRQIGINITCAVWKQAVEDGVAKTPVPDNVELVVATSLYTPTYDPLYTCGAHPLFCNNGDSYVDLPSEMMNQLAYKGTGYSYEERAERDILGLIPSKEETLQEQVNRTMEHVRGYDKMINKYIHLETLHCSNSTLFYKVLLENVVELLPILYTPTVGEACQRFGQIFNTTSGMYISIAKHKNKIRSILDNWHLEPDIIVVTDGGRILGLGDLGAGGMGIPIGKLHLYCAGGGFQPSRTLPIQLDVGCDTKAIVEDPFYLGSRMPRTHGKEHEEFCDEFMEAVTAKWPKCIIQFEDFQSEYALKYLERYRHKYLHFNDDVQGTAAIVTAGFINGMKSQGTELKDAKVVMFGAGSSAVGVATYLSNALVAKGGLSEEEAKRRIFMIDSKGLITNSRGDKLNEWKAQFARTDGPECATLLEAIKYIKPNAIFGLSGAGPSWNQEVIEALVSGCGGNGKPLVFPLSNPTSKAEITIQDAVEWSKGQLLFASGSPFPVQEYDGKVIYASQCNNMFIFPGVGMGAHLAKTKTITDSMLLAAAFVVADFVNPNDLKAGKLYPDLSFLRHIGKWITGAVWQDAHRAGVAQVAPPVNVRKVIKDTFYDPKY